MTSLHLVPGRTLSCMQRQAPTLTTPWTPQPHMGECLCCCPGSRQCSQDTFYCAQRRPHRSCRPSSCPKRPSWTSSLAPLVKNQSIIANSAHVATHLRCMPQPLRLAHCMCRSNQHTSVQPASCQCRTGWSSCRHWPTPSMTRTAQQDTLGWTWCCWMSMGTWHCVCVSVPRSRTTLNSCPMCSNHQVPYFHTAAFG